MKDVVDYDLEALRANLERCDDNIATFEKAIDDEMATKKRLRGMIKVLEEKQNARTH